MSDQKFIEIPAEYLLMISMLDAWKYLSGDIRIVFDNRETITCKAQHAILTLSYWRIYKKYPVINLRPKHTLTHHVGYNGVIGTNSHAKVMGEIVFDILDVYKKRRNNGDTSFDLLDIADDLKKLIFEIAIDTAWDVNENCIEWMSSIDYTHFFELSFHKPIRDVMLAQDGSDEMVQRAYAVIDAEMNSPALADNMLARAAKAGTIRREQLRQCIGPVGRRTDTDSYIFPDIITNGFIHGTRLLKFDAEEARSCAKALANAKDPLQKSEYFSRKMQMINSAIDKIYRGDCGTQEYLEYFIEPSKIEDGKVIPSDLDTMEGKYFLDGDHGLRVLTKNDKHLIGTTIKMRSPRYCCIEDPGAICEVCYGDTSIGIPEKSNAGHQSAVRFYSDQSQHVISTKHSDGNAIIESIRLADEAKKFMHIPHGTYRYHLKPDMADKITKLIIPMKHAMGLADISMTRDTSKLSLSRVSSLPSIRLVYTNRHGDEEMIAIETNQNKTNTNFSHEFITHIKKNGWVNKEGGFYEFDLTDWDFTLPVLSLQMKQVNMSDFQGEVADLIESTIKELNHRIKVVTFESVLREFHSISKETLSTHISILETIILSGMVVSNDGNDYRLPKPWTNGELGVLKRTMEGRSAAALMAFERHHDVVTDPKQFLNRPVSNHVFDGLLVPELVFGPKYGRTYAPKSKYHAH